MSCFFSQGWHGTMSLKKDPKQQETDRTQVQAALGEDHGGCEDFGFPGSYRQEPIRQHHRWWNHWPWHHYSLGLYEWFSSGDCRASGVWDGDLARISHHCLRWCSCLQCSGPVFSYLLRDESRRLPWNFDGLIWKLLGCRGFLQNCCDTSSGGYPRLCDKIRFGLLSLGCGVLSPLELCGLEDT